MADGPAVERIEGWDGLGVVSRVDAETGAGIHVALHSERLGPAERRNADEELSRTHRRRAATRSASPRR